MEYEADQQRDNAVSHGTSVPHNLIPQPPSRTFSRQQSSLRSSPLRRSTAEQNIANAGAPAMYSTAGAMSVPGVDQLPDNPASYPSFPQSSNSNTATGYQFPGSPVLQPLSPVSNARQQLSSTSAVPAIPFYTPPQSPYTVDNQAAARSMGAAASTSGTAPYLVDKPSR